MRKINPTLQSQGFNSFKDLLSRPSNVLTVGPNKCDFTSPLNAADAAKSGDLIFVFPSNYDVGNNPLLLPDNVAWHFFPNVKLLADIDGGIIRVDSNSSIHINRFPDLENSAGQTLAHYFDFQGIIFGPSFYVNLNIYHNIGSTFSVKVIDTNLPKQLFENASVDDSSAPLYKIVFNGPSLGAANCFNYIITNDYISGLNDSLVTILFRFLVTLASDGSSLSFKFLDSGDSSSIDVSLNAIYKLEFSPRNYPYLYSF